MKGYIYQITNSVNGKIYIGKTLSAVSTRWSNHKSDARKGVVRYALYLAMRKHGIESFSIETLERWEGNSKRALNEKLCEREKALIEERDARNPEIGYNMVDGGKGTAGWHPSSERWEKAKQTRIRNGTYKQPHSETTKRKIAEARSGYSPSLETRKKNSEAHLGRRRSEEGRANLRTAQQKNLYRICNAETEEVWLIKDLTAFCSERGLSKNGLLFLLHGGSRATGKYSAFTVTLEANLP
jgi:group I intron endonuclease